jgi:hypothetical protein
VGGFDEVAEQRDIAGMQWGGKKEWSERVLF